MFHREPPVLLANQCTGRDWPGWRIVRRLKQIRIRVQATQEKKLLILTGGLDG